MSVIKTTTYLTVILCVLPFVSASITPNPPPPTNPDKFATNTIAYQTLAEQLGWMVSDENYCGGYYLDDEFVYPSYLEKKNLVVITGNQGLISKRNTSFLEEQVTVIRFGEQMTAHKAVVYRNEVGKLKEIDLVGNVHLRKPNTLIVGKKGHYNFVTRAKMVSDVLYRTAINDGPNIVQKVPSCAIQKKRKVTYLSAWGEASEFIQTQPKIYELWKASFTTCPPTTTPAWRVNANHIVLDKNTGRGYATHARILVKDIPVLYLPYINFSIDKKRKTGFLWPTIGGSNKWGPYVLSPFYWNIAPNYDMTIIPGLLTKRGVRVTDHFRYLTQTSIGKISVDVLPRDQFFANFQNAAIGQYGSSTNPITLAALNRLERYSTTRKGFFWRDESHFNEHWGSNIDFNYAGDDYYLKDLGNDLNQITDNQLLQEGEVYYKGQNWNFIGRLQTYQTLHPIDSPPVNNQYRRLPQLVLDGDYPDQWLGLEYFINNEYTHFEFLETPGTSVALPVGDRMHTQPGVSWPLYWPFFYINPRVQFAFTDYNLHQTSETATPTSMRRSVPIFDIASGFAFIRSVRLFNHDYQQTLEPQFYYTYIPYRNQKRIPIFDTTVNTLTYDQLFNYNRFSGIDRIGDANQLSIGIATRFIDERSGLEKILIGVGGIIYFANRLVTLCNDGSCSDNPNNHSNYQRLSPLSGMIKYYADPRWTFSANSIWNPVTKQIDNASVGFHYQPDLSHIINFTYGFARQGDVLSGISTTSPSNNLKVTDFSLAWPILRDVSVVGRWSQNWNHEHLQNLLYGLQYDTCCWAMRFVGGRAFTGLDPNHNNKPAYSNEFYIQFALKGLGNIGSGNPDGLLSNINGYKTQFGQDF